MHRTASGAGITVSGAGSTSPGAGTPAARQGWRSLLAGCLLRWHLCSLDAPTIAVLWALLLGRLAGVALPVAQVLVLGLGTWIVYVLDRVLDGTGVSAGSASLRLRHHFHRGHRRILLRLCWLAAAAVALLCRQLPVRLVELYLALGVPVGAYALLVHRRLLWPGRPGASSRIGMRVFPDRGHGSRGYCKEAAVALLFTSAVAAPAAVAAQSAIRLALLPAALLLAALCWLNCSLISHAEGAGAGGPAWTRQRRQLIACALGLALAAAIACACSCGWSFGDLSNGVASAVTGPRSAPCAAAVLISCLLMLMLLMRGGQTQGAARRTSIRVLADLGLLSPLLFLLRHA